MTPSLRDRRGDRRRFGRADRRGAAGGYRGAAMADILGLDSMLAQIMLAVGLAMVFGNGFAMWKHARGEGPKGVQGVYRPGRARFLLTVGAAITVWGAVSFLV